MPSPQEEAYRAALYVNMLQVHACLAVSGEKEFAEEHDLVRKQVLRFKDKVSKTALGAIPSKACIDVYDLFDDYKKDINDSIIRP